MSEEFDEVDPLGPGAGDDPDVTEEYEVGYGKPPQHSKWPKGRSGNPSGRPKEVTNLIASFNAMMDEVDVTANDGRTVSKSEAIVRALIKDASRCDQKAFAKFLTLLKQAGELEPPPPAPEKPARSARAGQQSMDEFKAGFGKPLLPSDEKNEKQCNENQGEEEKQS
jgi:hypothetical protein